MRTDQKLYCLKCFLTVFLILLWVLGAAVFGVLLWLRLDYWTNEYLDIEQGLHRYLIIVYIFLIVGAIIVLCALFGLIGGHCRIKWCLVTFLTMLCIATALTIAVIAYGFVFREELENTVARGNLMRDIIQEKYKGNDVRFDTMTKVIDLMQYQMACCGGEGPRDYFTSNWAAGETARKEQAPLSCCKDYERYMNSANTQNQYCPILDPTSVGNPLGKLSPDINQRGCKGPLAEFFQRYIWVVAGIAIALLVFELINIIITSILINFLNNLYIPPQEEIVYDMAHNLEKSPYPSRGDYTGGYYR